jgi:hypothetical protein
MTETDERQGKPSASGIERLSLCPGSWNLERTLPPLPESEDAASGTRIHAAFAGETVELNEDEEDVLRRCSELYAKATLQIFGETTTMRAQNEHRIWGFAGMFSGKADIICIDGTTAAILDLKTGRNEVTRAEGNAQLRSLTVLLHELHPNLERIVVGIIQPWAKEQISLCEYNREDLAKAWKWLVDTLDAAEKPDAPRIPGEKQCRWCRAVGVCPEAQAKALAVTDSMTEMIRGGLAIEDVPAKALSSFLNQVAFAEKIINGAKDEARRRLDLDPESVPGWQLKEGATREVITDPEAVFARFMDLGGDSRQFMPCVTVAKAKLKDALKKVTGSKGKELDAELDTLLAGLTEQKQNAPSLERVKENQ